MWPMGLVKRMTEVAEEANPSDPESTPADPILSRLDSVSPLHNLMMLGHVEDKLGRSAEHLEWYRRKGLGMPAKKDDSGKDDMKILSTGPVHVTQTPESKPQANGLRSAVTAGLAVAALLGIPGAAAIAWLAKPNPAPIVLPGEPSEDTSVKIGLGDIEDLLPREAP